MEGHKVNRGAWRRTPRLPRAMTVQRGATVTAHPPWAESQPEARRRPDWTLAGTPPLPEPEPEPDPRPAPGPSPDLPPDEPKPAEMVRHGGCLCGAVRYELRGTPLLIGLCHCADCRKATGGHALHYGDWPIEAVTLEGRLSTFGGRSFCPDCGARVAHFSADHTEIMLGTLDDPPNDLAPQVEIWTVRREPWAQPVAGAMQFEHDPA